MIVYLHTHIKDKTPVGFLLLGRAVEKMLLLSDKTCRTALLKRKRLNIITLISIFMSLTISNKIYLQVMDYTITTSVIRVAISSAQNWCFDLVHCQRHQGIEVFWRFLNRWKDNEAKKLKINWKCWQIHFIKFLAWE